MYRRDNRSFVIRTARMSPHQRNAYEQMRGTYCVSSDGAIDIFSVFPHRRETDARPLILELGFGMGDALAQTAEDQPQWDFLGVEVHKPGVGKLMGEIKKKALSNLRIVEGDAVEILSDRLPGRSFSGIHIFFSDPWPKKRHHKRRMIRSGFPELVAPLLVPGGYVYIVTDWEDYAIQICDVFDTTTAFENQGEGYTYRRPWRRETAFERKGIAQGHRIYEIYRSIPLSSQ